MATINPFQGPINYAVDVQSPFEAAIGGFKLGAAGAEAQAQATARDRAAKAQTELTKLYANPFATAADYDKVIAFLPKDQATLVSQGFERKTKEQQQNTLQQATQVYTALKSGQPIVAKNLLTDQAAAYRKAGREQDAKATETYLQMIDINQPGAQTTIGLMIAALPGGKELLENVDRTLSTIRAEEKAPSELASSKAAAEKAGAEAKVATGSVDAEITKRKADAEKALSDATTALATADNAQAKAEAERKLAQAQAEKAKVDADYALYNTRADLEKKAADLGLTKEQKNQAIAMTNKLGEETAKITLELAALRASGGVDPAKKFEQEEKLRKEYIARTKVYSELGTTYQNMKSSADAKTGPGDIALITGFMKMLDPGSVVRETEFATARDTSGLYERLRNQFTQLESGKLFALDSKQRQEYVTLAKQYLDSAQKKAGEDKKALGVVVKNYSLNPDNVFGPETAAPPAAGQRNVTVDY